MSVAADIILIITAMQSNGNLSYTLNVFKTKHFLKSTQLVTRSEELVATVLKIYQQSEIAKPTGRAKWYAHTLHKKKSSCAGKKECECEGQNKLRTRKCKWGAHGQVKMRCACACKNAKPVCRPKCHAHAQLQMRCASAGQKKGAHAQAKMRCACAGLNEVRMRRPKKDAHEQVKNKCACASQNKMRTRRPNWDAHA